MVQIFVYGSLKRGFKQHERHMKGARFVCEAQTAEAAYHLVAITEPDLDFIYPAMVTGGTYHIKGEVFDIEEALLKRLDEYEGESYQRSEIALAGGKSALAYVYQTCPHTHTDADHPRILTQGDLQSWQLA